MYIIKTPSDFYWLGFEDGFANGVCKDVGMTPQEAFSYRKGFKAGTVAFIESQNQS